MRNLKALLAIIAAIAVVSGCSAPVKTPPPPSIGEGEKFFKNEGAHFELDHEYWYVGGEFESESGPTGFFSVYFLKVGSPFMHSRNGYSGLLFNDSYDYRSFGQGIIQVLAKNELQEKIEKFPDDKRYVETLDKLMKGESEHFYTMGDEERALHRGHLYISFGKNLFERTSETELVYDLVLDTWAGKLDLDLKAETDPIVMSTNNPIKVGDGEIQGYAFPRVAFEGSLHGEDGETPVKGSAWFTHLFGRPDGRAIAGQELINIRLDNGGAFLLNNYYDSEGELQNSTLAYLDNDGTMVHDWVTVTRQTDTWKSDISRTEYSTGWKLKGDVTGEVHAVYENSEVMLEQGVGTFWMGPCTFKGRIGGNILGGRVEGRGFCRVVGREDEAAQ